MVKPFTIAISMTLDLEENKEWGQILFEGKEEWWVNLTYGNWKWKASKTVF